MKNVLVDKSGIKKPKATTTGYGKKGLKAAVPEPTPDIVKRIRDIHITPDPTIKEFLQPIEPNLRRTPAIQLKQLPQMPVNDQLLLEQKILQDARDLTKILKDLPKDDVSQFRKFVRNLPSVGDLRLAEAVSKGDVIGIARAAKLKEQEITRGEQKVAAQELKKLNKQDAEFAARQKEIDERLKVNKPTIVTEKNVPKQQPH